MVEVYCSGPGCPQSVAAARKLTTLGYTNVHAFQVDSRPGNRSRSGIAARTWRSCRVSAQCIFSRLHWRHPSVTPAAAPRDVRRPPGHPLGPGFRRDLDTLSALEAKLDPIRFVRAHRSIVVQLDRVQEIEPVFQGEYLMILRDGTRLKRGRTYSANLRNAFNLTRS